MTDLSSMQLALTLANAASAAGEVPVGAVVLKDGVVIATGRNAPIEAHDPTAHAEIVALRAAALVLGNYRLDECELFVTLEPCAMCAGAMLHARLKRVVFGASDPKTGAAGSVVHLFSNAQLNHQTQVQGGVLADECAILLQDFFKKKREQIRVHSSPVRDDALRTPVARFAHWPDYPWQPRYVSDLCSLNRLRLHFIDEGPREAAQTYLCLHGKQSWSYLYRHMIQDLLTAGHRVVAPDLIGFGMSDKPKKQSFHTLQWHQQMLLEFIERRCLTNVMVVVPHVDIIPGLTSFMLSEPWYRGLLVAPIIFDVEDAPFQAPFPDRGHRAALRAFFSMKRVLDNTVAAGEASPDSAFTKTVE